MIAFEVVLNEKRLAVGGIGDDGVLTAIVTLSARSKNSDLLLQFGGLSKSREHVTWQERPLRVGDEVLVRIIDRKRVDRPRSRKRSDLALEKRQKEQYVRTIAKELGWKIVPLR